MRTHQPAALVILGADGVAFSRLLPGTTVATAGSRACTQAKAAHAELLVIAGTGAAALRDRARDCGLALFKDAGALVIAPL